MTDIFISYARSTAAQAQVVAETLRRLGYGVWRDDELPAHRAYAEVIEERLRAARAVVVVWSAEAVKSQWVRAEANLAREAGTLVQLRVDDCTLPLPFNEIQCADLSGWTGSPDTPGWQRVLESVDHLCGTERAQPAPVAGTSSLVSPPTSLRSILKKPVVLSGLAAAGVAVIAMLGVTLTRGHSAPTATTNQRIAFFGYTVDGSDPSGASTALAKSATDKMFQSLRAFRLDAAAPTETLDTPKDKRFAKAAAVGARYALSGEVRTEGAQGVLALRFEDVASHTTLWEKSFSGPLNDNIYLPAIPAWPASQVLSCIIYWESHTVESPRISPLIADLCQNGGYVRIDDKSTVGDVAKMRDFITAAPDSAGAQSGLAGSLALKATAMTASARAPLLAEAEAALSRSKQLDPKDPGLGVEERIKAARGIPLAEFDMYLRSLLPKLEKNNVGGVASANMDFHELYLAVGRRRDALDFVTALAANDPGNIGSIVLPGLSYAVLGQSTTAREQFERGLGSYPTAEVWTAWTVAAIFMGAGDAGAMLKNPPWFVPARTVDCLLDIRKANASQDSAARAVGSRRAIECTNRGDFTSNYSILIPAALGDADRTFARLEHEPRVDSASMQQFPTTGLFWPTARPVRADPRFLPLVERLGLMDYWRATKTQPDVCETEDAPFCRELKKTLATKH